MCSSRRQSAEDGLFRRYLDGRGYSRLAGERLSAEQGVVLSSQLQLSPLSSRLGCSTLQPTQYVCHQFDRNTQITPTTKPVSGRILALSNGNQMGRRPLAFKR